MRKPYRILTNIRHSHSPCLLAFAFCLLASALCQAQTIVDQDGQSLSFDKPFSRIISLYPAHTENLFALGLDKEILGVSKNDDYPAAAKAKDTFDYKEDPEKFIAAKPDLVIVRPMISRSSPELVSKLRLMGIQVISLQPNTIEETFAYWRTLGSLCGKEQAATEMIGLFKTRLTEIENLVKTIPQANRKRVYFEAIHSKMKTFAPDSMAIFALSTAGGINAAADAEQVRETNIAYYGTERLLAKANDIDIFLAQQGRMNSITEQTIYDEPGFPAIKAIKERQVFLIDETLVARPTPRMIDGIIRIGKILYPELFNQAFPD
jgi:iron complex transport system substrate-binding protein